MTVRATALATATVLLLGAGSVAVSVTASARETAAPAPQAAVIADTVAAAAPLAATIKAEILSAARERSVMPVIASTLRSAAQARTFRVVDLRARVLKVAKQQIGDRYRAGATGPSAFDCSGFTLYVYKVAVGKYLPHYSRAQYTRVKKISRKQARPGDLVFFLRNGAHHVGIYLGRGRMVDAAGYGKGVRISPISGSWWSRTYTGFGRLLPA